MGFFKKIRYRNYLSNCLKAHRKRGEKRFLILWNRGMGDVPLGVYGLIRKILHFIPTAHIRVMTRSDLKPVFELLENIEVIECPSWKRGTKIDPILAMQEHGFCSADFDGIFDNPDLTIWLQKDNGKYTPHLRWEEQLDALADRFPIDPSKKIIAVHVQTETHYNYEKNWPAVKFRELFEILYNRGDFQIILFGFEKDDEYKMPGILDLRGETSLYEMLAIIKNKTDYLLAPDSGVLCLAYYLNIPFALRIASLWADPRQGILRLGVPSPNPELETFYLIGKQKDPSRIPVNAVMDALLLSKEKVPCTQRF